jgi:hypothetical protein
MADIQQQLATLVGRHVKQVRKTEESPPRISVIDVAIALTGKSPHDAAQDYRRMLEQYPEVGATCSHFRFKGRGQRDTPVASISGIVELVFLLPGHHAARIRHQAASLLVRFVGGDLALVDDICRNRGLQEELAVQNPDDPRRLAGEAVEAAAPMGEQQLARVCSDIVTRTVPAILERLTLHIDERLARLESRQRVNLNVRAPKRPAAHNQPVARDIAHVGRPYPVSKFLNEKEREDPSWSSARKSFAPSFGVQVQILKKRKLRADGVQGIYVEQNHRAQLLYTDADRPLMEEAWALTEALREDLAGVGVRHAGARALPAASSRASVMDMLRAAQ